MTVAQQQPTRFAQTSAGDRIAFELHGEPSARPGAVFVAGAGPFRAIDPTTTETARLAAEQGVQALVYDRLGRGDSPAEGDLTLERELAAMAAAIDAVGGAAVLVGHSSGCAIALAAADAGLPVTGLVLWEAPIGQFDGGAAGFERDFLRHLDAGDLEAAQREYMRDMPPEFLEQATRDPAWPHIVLGSRTYRADARALAWAEELPLAERLAAITVPVVVAVGEHTFPGMTETAEALQAAIPTAGFRVLPGAMHDWEPGPMADAIAAVARD
ncbi:alpha/beta fold hydrolase [Agrococcus carbonis]|uniref:Lysophospholipase, alpha-beta hydrolase superfamily n=1 Tax=Agrococcus carbonis TaxID=684552 RepID=A0A1H1P6K0_9MICO|nr:alpha/beta hydrolase [Agrococcus carbonis]SDS06814.1 Lysophospholipase, alpha-beta hydrolase superfamily [Agrococcus carbonis]